MQQEKDTTNIENVIESTAQESVNYRFATDMDKELHDFVVELLAKNSIPRVSPIRKLFKNIKEGGVTYLQSFMFEEVPNKLSVNSQLTNNQHEQRQTNNNQVQD